MTAFTSEHGRTSILSVILQYVREAQAERRHHNELRRKVILTVSSGFTNGESSEQLKRRLDTIAGPTDNLEQFGGDAFTAALNIIRQEERLSPEKEASLDAVISRFDVPAQITERADLDLRRYRVRFSTLSSLLTERDSGCQTDPSRPLIAFSHPENTEIVQEVVSRITNQAQVS
jgi:hypothetical protein